VSGIVPAQRSMSWDPNEPPSEDLIDQSTAMVRQQVIQWLHAFGHSRLIDLTIRRREVVEFIP
jgi:hypothetical protein